MDVNLRERGQNNGEKRDEREKEIKAQEEESRKRGLAEWGWRKHSALLQMLLGNDSNTKTSS